jgi:hypothetical protein
MKFGEAVLLAAFAAAMAACVPEFGGLTGGTSNRCPANLPIPCEEGCCANDVSSHDAGSQDAGNDDSTEAARDATTELSSEDVIANSDAGTDCGSSCDGDADAHQTNPCERDGGPGGAYVTAARGAYCIDATEVTNGAYEQFLAAQPDASAQDQPPFCSWNTKLAPEDSTWPHPGEESFPVVNVDWCDAWSYCKWAGKRLCGQIGGGSVADSLATDPARSQWYLACAGDPGTKYPYGDTYQPLLCNGVNVAPPNVREVGRSTCEGHAPGVFDMSGNVFEWIDSCDTVMGASDGCRMMGGAFNSPDYELACDYRVVNGRALTAPNLGFRCCADL